MKKLTIKELIISIILGIALGFIISIGIDVIESKSELNVNYKIHTVDQEQIWTDLGIVNVDSFIDDHEYGFCKRADDDSLMIYDKTAAEESIKMCFITAHEIIDEF